MDRGMGSIAGVVVRIALSAQRKTLEGEDEEKTMQVL